MLNKVNDFVSAWPCVKSEARKILEKWAAHKETAARAQSLGVPPMRLLRLRKGVGSNWTPEIAAAIIEEDGRGRLDSDKS